MKGIRIWKEQEYERNKNMKRIKIRKNKNMKVIMKWRESEYERNKNKKNKNMKVIIK